MIAAFDDLQAALASEEPCRELDLVLRSNESFPTELVALTELQTLRVTCENGMLELPQWIGRMRGLKVLELHGELEEIPEGLGDLDTLRRLVLRSAGAFPPVLAQLRKLRELEIEVSTVDTAPMALSELDRLEALYLRVVRLEQVPVGLLALPNLRHLVLEAATSKAAAVTSLPSALPGLSHLEDLAILGWRMATLPPAMMQLTELRSLTLRRCSLEHLPNAWQTMAKLRKLDLSDNRLATLPPSVGSLTGLRELVLADNPMYELPPQIGQLEQLERLDLDGSRMKSLPATLGRLHRLQVLSVADTRSLLALPDSARMLAKLKQINLARGALTEVPPWVFDLPKLTSLRLDGNQIAALPDNLFNNDVITYLSVNDNPLREDHRRALERYRRTREEIDRPIDLIGI
ncbi:MAG: hypothetical protein KC457_06540 [Myxococcales bacterium]|nr:hypothetical protein [Myxococcales bacterium]